MTDDTRRTVDFVGFERFNITGGNGDDVLEGRAEADTLSGGGGQMLRMSGVRLTGVFTVSDCLIAGSDVIWN